MDHFTIPCAIRIDTKGVLDIPANVEVVVNDDGEYAGYVTEDGDIFAHRGLPSALEAYIAGEHEPAAVEPAPEPEPAADPPAEQEPAEALADDTPVEETADGQADSQQAD